MSIYNLDQGRGHGIIMNLSSYAPFIFTYNPEKVETTKKINYATIPNIGGSYKKRFFSGFDSGEVKFHLTCIDMESPTGVKEEIAFFESLREPDAGPFEWWTLNGNANFPPPQVYFQFGVSYIPLVWDVLDVVIEADHFFGGHVRGIVGIPKKCEIDITLGLVEDNYFNLANQIARKASMYLGSVESITREYLHKNKGKRKEMPGIFKNSKTSRRF